MENESIYFKRRADKHPAIQCLRKQLRDYLVNGGTRNSFSERIGMSQNQLNQYLAGVYVPRQRTIEKWANKLGISYQEMIWPDFDYIAYPFEELFRPKSSSRHVTKSEWRKSYDEILEEYESMVEEGEVDYNVKIVDLILRHKI